MSSRSSDPQPIDPPRPIAPDSTPEWARASAEAARTISLGEALHVTLDDRDIVPPPLIPSDLK